MHAYSVPGMSRRRGVRRSARRAVCMREIILIGLFSVPTSAARSQSLGRAVGVLRDFLFHKMNLHPCIAVREMVFLNQEASRTSGRATGIAAGIHEGVAMCWPSSFLFRTLHPASASARSWAWTSEPQYAPSWKERAVNRCVGRSEALDGERAPMVFYL
jgi:hypothetical protein